MSIKIFLSPELKEVEIKFENQGQHTTRLKIKQLEKDKNPRETSGITRCSEYRPQHPAMIGVIDARRL